MSQLIGLVNETMVKRATVSNLDGTFSSCWFHGIAEDEHGIVAVIGVDGNPLLELVHYSRVRLEDSSEPVYEEPVCPGPECSMCTGEYCAQHYDDPCDCNCLDRHKE